MACSTHVNLIRLVDGMIHNFNNCANFVCIFHQLLREVLLYPTVTVHLYFSFQFYWSLLQELEALLLCVYKIMCMDIIMSHDYLTY